VMLALLTRHSFVGSLVDPAVQAVFRPF